MSKPVNKEVIKLIKGKYPSVFNKSSKPIAVVKPSIKPKK